MKQTVIGILMVLMVGASFAQSLHDWSWDYVELPVDSLIPLQLIFLDSLHGFYGGAITDTGIGPSATDSLLGINRFYSTDHWFETIDGGRSWSRRLDTPFHQYRKLGSYYSSSTVSQIRNQDFIIPSDKSNDIYFLRGGGRYSIHVSTNKGKNWSMIRRRPEFYDKDTTTVGPGDVNTRFLFAYDAKDMFYYQEDSALIYRSLDSGRSFSYLLGDDVFRNSLVYYADTGHTEKFNAFVTFNSRSPFHWTFFVHRPGIKKDSILEDRFPSGVRTLVTTNGGKTFAVHTTPYPNNADSTDYSGAIRGFGQYDPLTKSQLFFFGAYGSEGRDATPNWVYGGHNDDQSPFNVNYAYSDDDGRTWKFVSDFVRRRHAYEPIRPGEVLLSLTEKDINIRTQPPSPPAYILARTTNNGSTWEYDSTALTHFEQKLDGRIITSIGPRFIWIAARLNEKTYLMRLKSELMSVESDIESRLLRGGYGYHYTLYPNPASESVTLDFYREIMIHDIQAINIIGASRPLSAHIEGSHAEIDLRQLPIGHYTLSIRHNWGISVIPLVVMR